MRSRALVVLSLVWIGCASSRPSGGGPDATAIDGPEVDAVVTDQDALQDSTQPDTSSPDAVSTIDATSTVDAATDAPAMVDAAIDANNCPTQPCSLAPQCGCTAPLTCDIDFTDLMGTACRAVNVPGTETSTCSSFSQCAGGYVCIGNRCERYCATDTDCVQPRGKCAIQITDQMGNPITGAITCSSNCDPAGSAAGACPAGDKCGFFTAPRGAGTIDIVDCTTPGVGGVGAACTDDSTCGANTLCSTYNAQQRCRRVCTRPAGNECAAVPGTTCVGFGTPLVIGGIEYGVCAP